MKGVWGREVKSQNVWIYFCIRLKERGMEARLNYVLLGRVIVIVLVA